MQIIIFSSGSFLFFLAAIAGAIYYPLTDILEAIYIEEDHNRTKQLSVVLIINSLAGVIAAAGGGFLLTHYSFDAVVFLVSLAFVLSIIPFLWLQKGAQYIPNLKPVDVYKFMVRDNFKPLWTTFFGQQLIIITNIVIIPIFIYTIVGELNALGYLIALALIVEKICTLTAGHYTDKLGVSKTIRFSAISYPLAMAAYIFLAKTPLSVFFVESYNKIAHNTYMSAYRSGIHAHARKQHANHLMLFGAGWQMSLCFGELLILPLYALLAYFIGINVFYVSCCAAALGIWIIRSHFKEA